MRRPVRMITLPSIASRRRRLGLPTSSAPSGVTVAALRPKRASAIAAAAAETTSFDVLRRLSSDRSWCSSSTSTPVTEGSSTRSACSSSSCPVSSPSRTMIRRPSGMSGRYCQAQLVGALLHRADHDRHVLVEVDAQLLGALAALVAVDPGREARLLEFILDRFGGEAVDAGRAD